MVRRTDELQYVRVDQLVLGKRLLAVFLCFIAMSFTIALLVMSIPAGGPPFLQTGTVFLNFASAWSLPGVGLAVLVPFLAIFDSRLATLAVLVYLAPTTALGLFQAASAAYAYLGALTGLFEFAGLFLALLTAAAEVVALGVVAVLYADQTRLGWGPLITREEEMARVRRGDGDAFGVADPDDPAGVADDRRRAVPLARLGAAARR